METRMATGLTPTDPPDGAALWRGRAAPAAGAVSALDVAAWLDGRLGDVDAARVEAALAADPALLSQALDASMAVREAAPDAASERLVVRARALVEPRVHAAPSVGTLLGELFGRGWRAGAQWSAVAAALLAVSVGGFSLGSGFGAAYAQSSVEASLYIVGPASADTSLDYDEDSEVSR
jgi:hypothetical protein